MQFAWDHSNIGENISFAGRILELTVDKKEIHGFSWTANESEVERLFMVLDDVRNDYEAPVGIQEFGDKLIQDLSS